MGQVSCEEYRRAATMAAVGLLYMEKCLAIRKGALPVILREPWRLKDLGGNLLDRSSVGGEVVLLV